MDDGVDADMSVMSMTQTQGGLADVTVVDDDDLVVVEEGGA